MVVARSIKLVALDMDGTILDKNGQLADGISEEIARITADGVRVILATGRMAQSARPYWEQLNLGEGPLIAYNGGLIEWQPQGTDLFKAQLPNHAAREIIQEAVAQNILAQVYVGHELWLSREDAMARRYIETNRITGWVKPLEEMLVWPEPPIKILLQDDPFVLDQLREAMQADMARQHVRFVKSQPQYLEAVPETVGKGPALQAACAVLDIPLEHVLAIGDGENDIDMLQVAGWGVAMGQAPACVKRAADVVAPSFQEKGALWALQHFVTGKA
ncbi:MAG: HAD family hydrolase [Firmicutes bacterium]|nr:HAD family hydrolase [Bacillota bacterium]